MQSYNHLLEKKHDYFYYRNSSLMTFSSVVGCGSLCFILFPKLQLIVRMVFPHHSRFSLGQQGCIFFCKISNGYRTRKLKTATEQKSTNHNAQNYEESEQFCRCPKWRLRSFIWTWLGFVSIVVSPDTDRF
uniref:Transmembrane protein n=1 Tax=Cacopsylla melanoneura TaxID=428564 RepID=A0A8D8LUS2_9HEMI